MHLSLQNLLSEVTERLTLSYSSFLWLTPINTIYVQEGCLADSAVSRGVHGSDGKISNCFNCSDIMQIDSDTSNLDFCRIWLHKNTSLPSSNGIVGWRKSFSFDGFSNAARENM